MQSMLAERFVPWQARLRARWVRWRRSYPHILRWQLRRHWPALVAVGVAALATQAVLLLTPYTIGFFQDSKEYYDIAKHIARQGMLFSPNRPPMYSAFLALISSVAGWDSQQLVVWVQAALMVASAFEVYFLGYILTKRRSFGAIVACVIALNLPTANMERSILSEAVAYWAAITMFLVFTRFLQTQARRYLFGFAAISVVGILERPAFLFLPLLLVVLEWVRTLRARDLVLRWRYILFALVAIYGCVTLYVLGNQATNDYLGFTYISDVNLFGKVLEYRMWNDVSDPALLGMRADIAAYMADPKTSKSPWSFGGAYPSKGYDSHYFAKMGAYAKTVILHHPLEYTRQSWHDIRATFLNPPDNLVPLTNLTAPWQRLWVALSNLVLRVYPLVIPLTAALLLLMLLRPRRLDVFMLACIGLYTSINVFFVAMTDYAALYRLRSPMDWGAIFVVVTALLVGGEAALRVVQGRPRRPQRTLVDEEALAETTVRPAVQGSK